RPGHLLELDLGQPAVLVIVVKNVAEDAAQRSQRFRMGVERNVAGAEAERAQVVEAQDVIGVAVGVEHGVERADAFADGLLAEVGRGVDEHGVAIELHQHRGTRAPVARIAGGAHGAAAADGGDAHRRPRTEHGKGCFHRWPTVGSPGAGWRVSMLVISTNAMRRRKSASCRTARSPSVRLPRVFSSSMESVSMVWRAPTRSTWGCSPFSCSIPSCIIAVMYIDATRLSKLTWSFSG